MVVFFIGIGFYNFYFKNKRGIQLNGEHGIFGIRGIVLVGIKK
jgi:hypothetical protein